MCYLRAINFNEEMAPEAFEVSDCAYEGQTWPIREISEDVSQFQFDGNWYTMHSEDAV